MRRAAPAPAASPCGHSIVPLVGSERPAIRRSAVDLPQPDGPTSETSSPARTARSSPSSAVTPLAKVLPTPLSATTGGPSVPILRAVADAFALVGLEHDPEKWIPVFGNRSCSTKKLERDDDSSKSHPALARPVRVRLLSGRRSARNPTCRAMLGYARNERPIITARTRAALTN